MRTKVFRITVPESCWDHFLQFAQNYGYKIEEIKEYRTEPLLPDPQITIDNIIRNEK